MQVRGKEINSRRRPSFNLNAQLSILALPTRGGSRKLRHAAASTNRSEWPYPALPAGAFRQEGASRALGAFSQSVVKAEKSTQSKMK